MSPAATLPDTRQPAYSRWSRRVGATLIDWLAASILSIPYYVGFAMAISKAIDTARGSTDSTVTPRVEYTGTSLTLMIIGTLLGVGFTLWNTCLRQGRSGYSIGKGLMGLRLVDQRTGEPSGLGRALARQLLHLLDWCTLGLGFLWPLWDHHRQTFADKIMSTIVVDEPSEPSAPAG